MDYQVKLSGQTTNAVATEIFLIDGTRFPIAYNATYRVQGTAIASDIVSLAAKEWSYSILIKNVAGTTSIIDYSAPTSLDADAAASTWDLSFAADDTNDTLDVTVTGVTGRTITWNVGFNFDNIGYTPTVTPALSGLNVPQIIDLVKLHHPKVPYTTVTQMLSNAQLQFCMDTKLNVRVSVIPLAGKTLIGTTKSSPLVVADIDPLFSWSFYKDDTTDTIIMLPSDNVIYFLDVLCVSSNLQVASNQYSIQTNGDKSVNFYDTFGTGLTDFSPNVPYLYIEFVKNPADLTTSSTCNPEIPVEYHNALALPVIADLYKTRTDLVVTDRLMMAKSFDNDWKESCAGAKREFRRRNSLIPITMSTSELFSR